MQFKQLTAFCAVAQSASFSKAAKTTGLSQPTLSRLVKQLEDELAAELIDRYHRPLQLTPVGVFFYEQISALLHELDGIGAMTTKMANPPSKLVIGFVPSVLYGLLPEVIALLKQKQPTLDINLKDISSYQQLQALKTGQIDVGFGRFMLTDKWIAQTLLRHERYVVALPRTHAKARLQKISLTQLQDEQVILYHQTRLSTDDMPPHRGANSTALTNPLTEPLLAQFAKHGCLPFATTSVSDLQVALGLVAAGVGITLVPDSLKTYRHQQISYHRLIHEDATSPIYLNTLKQLSHPMLPVLLDAIYTIYEKRGITYRKSPHAHL